MLRRKQQRIRRHKKRGSVSVADIIIDDDYVIECKNQIETEGKKLEDALTDYVKILGNIKLSGIIEGETANALDAFIQTASEIRDGLKGRYSQGKVYCGSYIDHIDDADEYLY